MTSLKRLRDPSSSDETDSCLHRADPICHRGTDEVGTFGSNPTLVDQSWAGLWGELLISDCSDGNLHLDPGDAQPIFDAFCYAENSIEAWAAQDASSFEAVPAPTEPGAASATSQDSVIGTESIAEQLCYGMVCHSDMETLRLLLSTSLCVLNTHSWLDLSRSR